MVNNQYFREYWAKRREFIVNYLGGKCDICGSTENLEIDHIDPSKKSFNISPFDALDKTMSELEKCHLLCKKHHLEKTSSENSGFTHGTMYGWMRKKCQCDLCNRARRKFHDDRNEIRRSLSGNAGRGKYDKSPIEHGTYRMYKRGCKCEKCRKANSDKAKELRNKKRHNTQLE